MPTSHDIIILGGGCAGLSLATRLCGGESGYPRAVVVEQRDRYTNDRTWCFWACRPGGQSDLVTQSWSQFSVRNGGDIAICRCANRPYQMIPSDSFYGRAAGLIASSRNIDLRLGARVSGDPVHQMGIWSVETSAGTFTAPHVVDTRPRRDLSPSGAVLWQSFFGCEVSTPAPAFDPSTVELMDFQEPVGSETGFLYVLPFSSSRALVEYTVFDRQPWSLAALRAELWTALSRRSVTPLVERSEFGVLPMGLTAAPQPGCAGYVRAGVTSGAARPSSGYAFQRIQRWADECARRIRAGQPPIGHQPDPPILRLLDSLFLSVLRHQPHLAPSIFLSLHQNANINALLRFMSDQGGLADYARIAGALPFKPFLREIPRALLERLRGQPSGTSARPGVPVLARGKKS